jgi:hypothetical protein
MNGALDGAPTAGGVELGFPLSARLVSRVGQVMEGPCWSRREEVGGSATRE